VGIKERLQAAIEEAREREAAELIPRVDDRLPGGPGRWTIKDTVGHLSAWRTYASAMLDAARTGAAGPGRIDDTDAENARIYASMKDLPATEVRESARESWEALRQALHACSELVLLGPRPGWPEQVTWSVIPGNAHVHIAEHLGYLAAERGDPSAAEEVAQWAHRLDVRLSPDGPERGNGDYNLACFYARVGRADRALPLLADAFRRNAALKEWAGKDGDLDQIRDHPEFRRLLG
jgi:hypothetical protein